MDNRLVEARDFFDQIMLRWGQHVPEAVADRQAQKLAQCIPPFNKKRC